MSPIRTLTRSAAPLFVAIAFLAGCARTSDDSAKWDNKLPATASEDLAQQPTGGRGPIGVHTSPPAHLNPRTPPLSQVAGSKLKE